MAENLSLSTFANGDTDYVTNMNADNRAIESFGRSVQADVDSVFEGLGVGVERDMYESRTSSAPDGGVIGADSLRLNLFATGLVTMVPANEALISKAYIDGSRYQVSGTITYDLDDLGLSPGTYTMYIGVGVNTTTNTLEVQVSPTVDTGVELPLYITEATTNGSWTFDETRRYTESLLFDNTTLQAILEQPVVFQSIDAASIGSSGHVFQVPFDHKLVKSFWVSYDAASGSRTYDYNLLLGENGGTTSTTIHSPTYTTSATLYAYEDTDTSSPWSRRIIPAGAIYYFEHVGDTGAPDTNSVGIEVIPQYGMGGVLYSIP